jgi:hypothetical protein
MRIVEHRRIPVVTSEKRASEAARFPASRRKERKKHFGYMPKEYLQDDQF